VTRPWTLRRRLVVGIVSIVAVILGAFGVVSIVSMSAAFTTVVDGQLAASMSALNHAVDKQRQSRKDETGERRLIDFASSGPDAIAAIVRNGTVVDTVLFLDPDPVTLGDAASRQLGAAAAVAVATGHTESVDLISVGSYRITTEVAANGDILVAGVPLARVHAAVIGQTITIGVLGLGALAAVMLGVVVVVRRSLRPLARVVDTAVAVTRQPLEKGTVVIGARVAAADTDPRTEIGQVGEALNLLLEHFSDALAVRVAMDTRMRRFVTDASHEMRTPLAAIQGYAELTRQETEQLPQMTEYALTRIEAEAARMGSLVSDLLLLARLDEGQDLHLDDVDLSNLVVNAVSDTNASAPDHKWIVEVPENTVIVRGDAERLHQLVTNLLANAATHTPIGSTVAARLRVLTHAAGSDQIELRIEDDGPGISEELLPTLFERFARGDSSRSRASGSSGLGLAIALSIVEAHGGAITVNSTSAGTSFRVLFASDPSPLLG
jgi:two-component system sensor histidine kinase TrcS